MAKPQVRNPSRHSSWAGFVPCFYQWSTLIPPKWVLHFCRWYNRVYNRWYSHFNLLSNLIGFSCSFIMGKDMGMLYIAEKSEHLPINTNGRGNVDMDGTIIPQVTAHRHQGVMLNQKITWNNHIDNLHTSCAGRVGILRRLRNKLQSQVFKKIFIGSIRPKLEYACAVWSGGPITKLIRLQEAFCHRHKVHIPPLQKRFQFHSLVWLFKMRQKLSPRYLSSLLPETMSTSSMYNLGSHHTLSLLSTKNLRWEVFSHVP